MKSKVLWIALLGLVLLSPLGLWLPEKLGAGSAWGEWSKEEMRKMVGYVPKGMDRDSDRWRAPLPDYEALGTRPAVGYILSGLAGVAVTAALVLLLGRVLVRREQRGEDPSAPSSSSPGGG